MLELVLRGRLVRLHRERRRKRDAIVTVHIEARPQAELLGRRAERAGHVLRGELAPPVLLVLDGDTPEHFLGGLLQLRLALAVGRDDELDERRHGQVHRVRLGHDRRDGRTQIRALAARVLVEDAHDERVALCHVILSLHDANLLATEHRVEIEHRIVAHRRLLGDGGGLLPARGVAARGGEGRARAHRDIERTLALLAARAGVGRLLLLLLGHFGDRLIGLLRVGEPLLDAREDPELVQLKPVLRQLLEADGARAARAKRVAEQQQREQHRHTDRFDEEDEQRLELGVELPLGHVDTIHEKVVVRRVAHLDVVLAQVLVLSLDDEAHGDTLVPEEHLQPYVSQVRWVHRVWVEGVIDLLLRERRLVTVEVHLHALGERLDEIDELLARGAR